ncbi:MAG: hypothetical protein IJH50_14665 [Kiritimatiellae bacterium]|nr:hypothetical protein [Kiritimatiellia bacterium]
MGSNRYARFLCTESSGGSQGAAAGDMEFYEKYIETVTGNDEQTRLSVDAIMGRMDELLKDRPDGRLSGLVVGRVQSGKTRNYVGLALKAAEAGWNVIIVLTSAIKALAEQTEKRMERDFRKSRVFANCAAHLDFLGKGANQDAEILSEPDATFFFWGVAMKQTTSLGNIERWLSVNSRYEKNMRVLVIDDEADNATPDSNAGNEAAAEERESFVQSVADAMLKEEKNVKNGNGKGFRALSEWLDGLWMQNDFDEEANTPQAACFHELKEWLALSRAPRVIIDNILDSDKYKHLLGLDALADENDKLGEDLAAVARRFFSGRSELRSPGAFVRALQSVFAIAKGRSRINKAIISLVDKPSPDATDYIHHFEKCAYIAYTATPYACILNERPDQTTIYADFIYSLGKSPKYFGLDEIYGQDIRNATSRMDIVRSIPDEEEGGILAPIEGARKYVGSDGKERLAASSVRIKDNLDCVWEIPVPAEDSERFDDDEDDDDCCEDYVDMKMQGTWQTLKDSIAWAFCCAAARRWRRINVPRDDGDVSGSGGTAQDAPIDERWTTMLFNISQMRVIHDKTAERLKNYLDCRLADKRAVTSFTRECKALWKRETSRFTIDKFDALFQGSAARKETYGEVGAVPPWEAIEEHFRYFLRKQNRHVIVINSTGRETKENQSFYTQSSDNRLGTLRGDHLWFICGGNTIARGLTLEGLVASYFDRVKKSVAVDTMTQMGRWFGYRIGYELLPRVWMTPYSVREFKYTAIVEDRMHASIADNFANKSSPCDCANYQMVYYYGRKLSGRAKAMRKLDVGVGTYGSTNEISIDRTDAEDVLKHVRRFMAELQVSYALTREEQKRRERECLYGRTPLWRNVPKARIASFLEDVAVCSPDSTRRLLKSLAREAANDAPSAVWDVVVAEPANAKGGRVCDIGGPRRYALGRPSATTVVKGVARFSAARLHMPYYADIPTRAINAMDFKVLRDHLDKDIIPSIAKELENGARMPKLEKALAPYGKGTLKERFAMFMMEMDREPYEKSVPEGIHGKIRGKLEGFRNRSSSEYMEAVHKLAGNCKPMLQIYLIEPPKEAKLGNLPLVALAFYWPAHEPDKFLAVTTGLEETPPPPSPRKFYRVVEEVLADWDFPMATKRLRNTVIERLWPSCTASFFDTHIAKIPEGWKYEAVPKCNAYMPQGWGAATSVNKRMAFALCEAAINLLRKDSKKHKSSDVFAKILEDPKLGDFFRANDPNDLAYFNGLLTGRFLSENGIKKTCGRPITLQYQG